MANENRREWRQVGVVDGELTASDAQIARLAATGRTNREIAQTLFVARRPSRPPCHVCMGRSVSAHERSLQPYASLSDGFSR
jgi:hypothetical protein